MINGLTVCAIVPARGGSKRIPQKNIKLLAGKPLIAYTLEEAKKSKYIDRIVVSTDHEAVAGVAGQWGAETPFLRPAELAADDATDLQVFTHALEWLEQHEYYRPDVVVQLRPTSPLRTAEHIDSAIELLNAHPQADSVRTVAEPDQSPYKMYKLGEGGYLEPLLSVSGVSESFNLPGQSLPRVYKHVGYVDAAWRRTIMEKKQMTGALVLPLILDKAYSGINKPEDWDYYEFLISRLANGSR